MLVGMDMPPAGPWTAPWVALGIVLVIALVTLAAAPALRRRAAHRPPPGDDRGPAGPRPGYRQDDLPGFLESPPGAAGRGRVPGGGWPSLAGGGPAPAPAAAPEPRSLPTGRTWAVVLGALVLAAVLALAVLAVVEPPGRPGTPGPQRAGPGDRTAVEPTPPPAAPVPGEPAAGDLADASVRPGRGGGAARLEFGGLVLEQRAVGVTATYPALEVSWHGTRAVAHLRLPTFNCLSAAAPEDPVAAGCVPSVPEYADLPSPALAVSGDDGTVQLSGRFPTYVRPNGSPPSWTGHVFDIRVRAAPADGAPAEGWVRAEGEIRLGAGRAQTLDSADVTVLRRD